MKKRKHTNRAQRRRSAIQEAIELTKLRAHLEGIKEGERREYGRTLQLLTPSKDMGVVDLSLVNVRERPRMLICDMPEGIHLFEPKTMAYNLPNGTVVYWYEWEYRGPQFFGS